MADLPLDWNALAAAGSMVGSGAIVVCGEGRCMLDMALNAVRFFRNESCGKCVPCRNGSQKMTDILIGWTQGKGTASDLALLDELGFGLDLAACAATGSNDHLIYVSPKSGRAVSASAGADYKDRLLRLPGFLAKGRQGAATIDDVVAGLALTGHFLETRVLIPREEAMPAARLRFKELIERRAAAA